MNQASWMDFQAPAGAQPVVPTYPTIQWFNGGQGSSHPVLENGGWELPVKWFGEVLGEAHTTYEVEHSGADRGSEPAYLFDVIHVAAVMKHVGYYRGVGGERKWTTEYRPGFYSRVKLLGFVEELERERPLTPVVVTFRSSVARDFNAVTRQFRTEVLEVADRLAAEMAREAGREAPDRFLPYAFWLPVGSLGRRVKTGSGQQSRYAPLVGKWDSQAFEGERTVVTTALQAFATPAELRDYVREVFYEEAREWLEREREKLARQVEIGEFSEPEGD